MNLFELGASLTLNDSGFEQGVANAEHSAEGLSATGVAMGNVLASAFEKAIAKLWEFGQQVISVGSSTETALAKVSTIMDTSVLSTDSMNKAITALSKSMGISVEELSDTVYNAISATGDTANAVKLAENASKLATAGFTDSTSALQTLTTAMNAYGLSADQVTHISDSLITVQNLGVTTVSELSANMGRAIATASAYGVDLNNLESAYVSTTKAGINTAESTTYISGMLKELGDSGSKVGKLLQEKTGKSFGELMADGKTLGDVLGILNDSVDGNAEALMGLWGSAEAGKASNAIVSQGLETFNDNLNQIHNSAGATESAYAVMSDTFQHKTEVLKANFDGLKASIFEKLEPVLVKLVDIVGELIDNFDKFAPYISAVVAGITAFATIAGVIKGVAVAQGILNAVLNANPIVGIISLIVMLITWLATLWATNEDFRNKVISNWNTIKQAFSAVGSAIGAVINSIANFFKGLVGKISSAINSVISTIKGWVSNMRSIISGGIPAIISNIVSLFKSIPSKLAGVGGQIVQGLINGVRNTWGNLVSTFTGLFSGLVSKIKSLLGIKSPSRVFASIGKFMAQGMEIGWEDGFKDTKDTITSGLNFNAGTISATAVGGSNGGVTYNQTINVNREVSTADQLARAIRTESRYGLMRGVAIG